MKIGYARVSTQDQHLDRQLTQLEAEGCERVYQEKASGKNTDRPELQRMLETLREGDVVLVSELTRISRSVKDLFSIVEQIHNTGAEIKSIKEPWMDTTTPQGRLVFTVFAGLSEFERELIRQRTIEGLKAARARGRHGGRRPLDPEKVELALKMYNTRTCSIAEIKKATGISKAALYSYLNKKNS